MQSNKKLHIIGNGFDLCHGLATKYEHFADYLEKNNSNMYALIIKYFGSQNEKKELWKNFEKALGNINVDVFFYKLDETQYQNYQMEQAGLYNQDPYTMNFDENSESIGDALNLVTHSILREITKWIDSIDISHISNNMNLVHILSQDDLYINFNYTSVLEEKYNIPVNKITYIHGKAG